MLLLKIPLSVGFMFWAYFVYRLGKTVLTNTLNLEQLFGALLIAAVTVALGCAMAGLWSAANENKSEH